MPWNPALGITDQKTDGTLCCSCTEQRRCEVGSHTNGSPDQRICLSEGRNRSRTHLRTYTQVEYIFLCLPDYREFLCLFSVDPNIPYPYPIRYFPILKQRFCRFSEKGKGGTVSLFFLLRCCAVPDLMRNNSKVVLFPKV